MTAWGQKQKFVARLLNVRYGAGSGPSMRAPTSRHRRRRPRSRRRPSRWTSPVAVVYRASWPDEQIVRGTLSDIRAKVRAAKITRTALILVGRVLDEAEFTDSKLYAPDHVHLLRPKRRA